MKPDLYTYIRPLLSFRLGIDYQPRGDQPAAIDALVRGLKEGEQHQVLLGVTGSGKTFTMAKVMERIGVPALVLAHNKTLAAQLYQEFQSYFPSNAVEYFVSYYDYYQPEAYIPAGDVYIEKEATINDELDKMRLSATRSLFERRDCIIVASVSCIYGLGSPEAYYGMLLMLEKGQKIAREEITSRLVDILYERHEGDFKRGSFRVRGDVVEIFPTYDDFAYRVSLWGDEIESLEQIDPLTGQVKQTYLRLPVYPKTHYVMSDQTRQDALRSIENELGWWREELEKQGKRIEAQRIYQRTMFDLEMIKQIGYCHGIENYSRHFSGRLPGQAPPTLLDYLPADSLLFIDESHQTMPQIQGMYHGDRSRKENLVKFGFRLPSALDNRPLTFEEFENRVHQAVYVSATPGPYELTKTSGGRHRTDHPPHGPGGSGSRGASDSRPGGRPAARNSSPGGERRARAGHHADQAHGGRSLRALHRGRRQVRVPPFGGFNARPREDSARSSARRLRCADRRKPVARRVGFAGGFAGSDFGRRQRGVLALGGVSDSDHGPGGA